MNADAWKKRLLLHLPYGVIGLAAAKLSEAWRLSAGTDFSAKFLHLRDGAEMAFRNGMSGFVPLDLLIGFLCGCALCLLVYAKRRNAKKYRHGEEYGAARWGKPSDIAPFMDADPWNNIILTQTERLTMSSRPANPKKRAEQERTGHRRFRQRQNTLFHQAQHHAVYQNEGMLPRGHRPKRDADYGVRKDACRCRI